MFTLPALTYGFDALEPVIDTATMQLHHDKHHQTYVDKLNEAVTAGNLGDQTIEQLLAGVSKLPPAIRNHGGGHYNHSLFWTLLAQPGTGGQPSPELTQAISTAFQSMDNMQKLFNDTAVGRFGSGWAWLVTDKAGQLTLGSTPNQDNPLMDLAELHGTPILALDVWEHAYYLKYQNKRPDYVTAFWQVVNWTTVSQLYQMAKTS